MPSLKLKGNHKAITTYYAEINNLAQLRMFGEGTVFPAFAGLLRACANQFQWTLSAQYPLKRAGRNLRIDGALVDAFNLVHGYWEAKDSADDLPKEVKKSYKLAIRATISSFKRRSRSSSGRMAAGRCVATFANRGRWSRCCAPLAKFFATIWALNWLIFWLV